MTPDPNDREYEEHPIEDVRKGKDGYELKHDGAFVLWCPKVDGLPAPRVGETLRTYGKGFGFPVRGIVVGGRCYRYETHPQMRARQEDEQREREAQREIEWQSKRGETDARIEALPVEFRQRLYKFQRDGGTDYRRDYEAYELFCCEQAVVIATAFASEPEPIGALRAWSKLPWEAQRARVSALSTEHSGNTFGMAVRLAHWYLGEPENVVKEHGALTPLVGCEAYGCVHPSAEAPR